MKPSGVQPFYSTDPRCSVCESKEVYFERIVHWEDIEYFTHTTYVEKKIGMLRYCQSCYDEYSGKIDYETDLSSEFKAT